MSSSLSLLSDALHSALDVGTFLINLWAESRIRRAGNQNLYVEIGAPISKEHHGYNDLRMQIARRKESAEWYQSVGATVVINGMILLAFCCLP
eukprot:1392971-Amorphochlora_amoeboformis.AAC.1